jgi:hypothetical protein
MENTGDSFGLLVMDAPIGKRRDDPRRNINAEILIFLPS